MIKLTKNEVRNMCIADQAAYINEVCASCGVDPYFYIAIYLGDWYSVYDVEDLIHRHLPRRLVQCVRRRRSDRLR